jgi:zinc transporter ZupT
MISVSIVDLWFPLVFKDGFVYPTAFVAFGFLIFYLISKALSKTRLCHEPELLPLHENGDKPTLQQRNIRVTAMMFLALTLHNFPEVSCISRFSLPPDSYDFAFVTGTCR